MHRGFPTFTLFKSSSHVSKLPVWPILCSCKLTETQQSHSIKYSVSLKALSKLSTSMSVSKMYYINKEWERWRSIDFECFDIMGKCSHEVLILLLTLNNYMCHNWRSRMYFKMLVKNTGLYQCP